MKAEKDLPAWRGLKATWKANVEITRWQAEVQTARAGGVIMVRWPWRPRVVCICWGRLAQEEWW